MNRRFILTVLMMLLLSLTAIAPHSPALRQNPDNDNGRKLIAVGPERNLFLRQYRQLKGLPTVTLHAKQTSHPSALLERLVSPDQLLDYPSAYRRFNQAYEDALACLAGSRLVKELYIVQYRSQVSSDDSGSDLYFSYVPRTLISDSGPYHLRDICGIVRK